MSIRKWSPFDMEKFWEEDFWGAPSIKFTGDLAVDVYEDNGNVIAEMQVPGVDPSKIDISIEGDILKVCGFREEKKEKKEKEYYHKEIRRGEFRRFVRLPHTVLADKATAEFKDGSLKIIMPKKTIEEVGKVKVKVSK